MVRVVFIFAVLDAAMLDHFLCEVSYFPKIFTLEVIAAYHRVLLCGCCSTFWISESCHMILIIIKQNPPFTFPPKFSFSLIFSNIRLISREINPSLSRSGPFLKLLRKYNCANPMLFSGKKISKTFQARLGDFKIN